MKVRRGTSADVPRALEIWRSAVEATHQFLSAADRAEIDGQVVEQFLPHAELWIAADAMDRPMGFLVMDQAKIEALFVDPAVHGKAMARILSTMRPRSIQA